MILMGVGDDDRVDLPEFFGCNRRVVARAARRAGVDADIEQEPLFPPPQRRCRSDPFSPTPP